MTEGEHCTHGGPNCWERECGRYKKKISLMKKVREGKEGQSPFSAFMGGKYPCILDCKDIGYLMI